MTRSEAKEQYNINCDGHDIIGLYLNRKDFEEIIDKIYEDFLNLIYFQLKTSDVTNGKQNVQNSIDIMKG